MALSDKDLELRAQPHDDSSINAGEISPEDKAREQKVLSKFDKFVMPQMAILVLFAYLDRTNIGMYTLSESQPVAHTNITSLGNARVFGFEEDTGMAGMYCSSRRICRAAC